MQVFKFKLATKYPLLDLIICLIIIVLLHIWIGRETTNSTKVKNGFSYNIGNKWHYEFSYLEGKVNGSFAAKNSDTRLIYSSLLEKGNIRFELYDAKNTLITSFQAKNTSDTIKNLIHGEKYRVRAIAQNAKGSFYMEMD
ncbi:MAG: hypothetical protein LBQ60_00215 [Bacteroidales bacterium]|nr:hypothetical protein [Bacteroidales bacterium]